MSRSSRSERSERSPRGRVPSLSSRGGASSYSDSSFSGSERAERPPRRGVPSSPSNTGASSHSDSRYSSGDSRASGSVSSRTRSRDRSASSGIDDNRSASTGSDGSRDRSASSGSDDNRSAGTGSDDSWQSETPKEPGSKEKKRSVRELLEELEQQIERSNSEEIEAQLLLAELETKRLANEELERRRQANLEAREAIRQAQIAAKEAREAEEQRQQAAIKLQAVYRGRLARKDLIPSLLRKRKLEQIEAAKAAKLKQREMRKERLKKEKLLLLKHEKKRVEEEMRHLWLAELGLKKRHDAIQLIQRNLRGMQARRHVRALREARAKEIEIRSAEFRDRQEREARDRHLRKVELERQHRHKLERELERGEWLKLADKSASRIQAAFRGRMARKDVALYKEKLKGEEQKQKQERYQAEVRRRLEIRKQKEAKEEEKRREEERAAQIIQTRYRGKCARQRVGQMKDQRFAAQQQQERFNEQESLRRHLEEQERLRAEAAAEEAARQAAAIKIQTGFRGKIARKEVNLRRNQRSERLERERLELLEEEARREGAATKMQAQVRGNQARQKAAALSEERQRRIEEEERHRQELQRLKEYQEYQAWLHRKRGASLSGAGSLGVTLGTPVNQKASGCGPVGGFQASTARSRSSPSGSVTGGGLLRAELMGGLPSGGHLPVSKPGRGPCGPGIPVARSANIKAERQAPKQMQSSPLAMHAGTGRAEADTGALRPGGLGGPAALVREADVALRTKLESMGRRLRAEALERALKPAPVFGDMRVR